MSKFEFGGPIGVTIIMIWSHLLLYYFWYCLTFNQGNLAYPATLSDLPEFLEEIRSAIATYACFRLDIFLTYVAFIVIQFILASFMPGIKTYGLPLENQKDKRLLYFCNAYSCYYLTFLVLISL
jgi:delta24(24(1))-sterol reductase